MTEVARPHRSAERGGFAGAEKFVGGGAVVVWVRSYWRGRRLASEHPRDVGALTVSVQDDAGCREVVGVGREHVREVVEPNVGPALCGTTWRGGVQRPARGLV